MGNIRQDIFIEQQQKLFMTTELRQAISVLQMSSLDLNEHIIKNIEENPFLDDEGLTELDYHESSTKGSSVVTLEEMLASYLDTHNSSGHNDIKQANTFEKYLSNSPCLYEHLAFQLNMELRDPSDILIGNYLIGCIDGNGYLAVELSDVADTLKVSVSQVEGILEVIHSFHPLGVGARNLQECLLLQVEQKGKDSPIVTKIIQAYLEELADRKFHKIAQALMIEVIKIQEAYDIIRKLDPKPGLQYSAPRNSFVWPDVTLIKEYDGYTVIINDQDYSYLKINRPYVELLRQSNNITDDARRFLEKKLESALGLIRGIEQRRINIYKVVQCIADIQKEFLENGIEYLKPLTMSRVADILNIHESTVSRVTSNKYVQTPRGLFALKYFFDSGVASQHSDLVCSKSVKHLIREIINNEDLKQPLSDQEIRLTLANKGINIARRTVNKYRQSMGIPTNALRKRYE